LSIGCPDLASGVQIWPAVSRFGQFWPILANLVHVASSYTHWVVLRGRRWALKSGIFFEKCGSNRHCGFKHCRAGRVAVSVARVVGWVEVEARDPRATASAQPPARTPTCARRCRALLMVPGLLRRGPVELSKSKCTHGIQAWPESLRLFRVWVQVVILGTNGDGEPLSPAVALGLRINAPRRGLRTCIRESHVFQRVSYPTLRGEACQHSRAA
jgi:hypothetical protein